MRRALLALAGVLLAVGATGSPAVASGAAPERSGEVVRAWTGLAMDAVRGSAASDARAARTYAMVDVAMFDAVNGIASEGRYAPALVAAPPGTVGDPVVAAATAAHDVLTALFPGSAATYDARLARDAAPAEAPALAAKGGEWGAYVARAVLAARATDGIAGTETQPGGTGIGEFTAPWNAQPRHLAPFAVADPAAFVDGGPPPVSSAEYADAYADVRAAGNRNVPNDAYQRTFDFWALSGGTNQPPGAWLQVAQQVSGGLSLVETARLFALESMAMADTVAPTYETKFRYHGWRPTTAIRYADDGNALTETDPSFVPRALTVGGSPQHYSGHSAFSAAAAEVLARVLCTDAVTFALDTDDAAGLGPRVYTGFAGAAAEAGRSRVYGGQHFEFSNQAGLRAGRAVADEVLATALLPTREYAGSC